MLNERFKCVVPGWGSLSFFLTPTSPTKDYLTPTSGISTSESVTKLRISGTVQLTGVGSQ